MTPADPGGRGKMHRLAFAALVLGLVSALPAQAGECAASPLLTGACFTVHGRLTTCTGIPNATLWVVGTKRILGVVDGKGRPNGDGLLPPALGQEMFASTPCAKAAFGDFTVCPLAPDVPGVMRRVCVVAATRLVIRDR